MLGRVSRLSHKLSRGYCRLPPNFVANSHCGFCGTSFVSLEWPRVCTCCEKQTFRNPIPVAVGLVPVKLEGSKKPGLLLVQRAIPPFVDEFALPGGFVDWGESWQTAVSRELKEETNLETDPEEFKHVATHSTPDGTRVLIFGASSKIRTLEDLKAFQPSTEVSSLKISDSSAKLCFSLHQSVFDNWFAEWKE